MRGEKARKRNPAPNPSVRLDLLLDHAVHSFQGRDKPRKETRKRNDVTASHNHYNKGVGFHFHFLSFLLPTLKGVKDGSTM